MSQQQRNVQQNQSQKEETDDIQLKQVLGKGGEGVVYLGELNGEDVAVKYQKELSEEEKQLYRKIKKSQQQGQIQNIVKIKSISLIDNPRVYEIVMELGNQNLHQHLESSAFQNYTLKQKDELFLQAIKGVKELHQNKYFHRDIKPENFVLGISNNKRLKLIDFGLATEFITSKEYTLDVGSAYYMSPEVTFSRFYNQKVDVWALGLIYFEILTGYTFFNGNTINEIKQKIRNITQEQINQQISQVIQDKEIQEILKQTIQINSKERISVVQLEQQILNKIQKLNNSFWEQSTKLIPLIELPNSRIIYNNQFFMKSPLINMELEVFKHRYFIIYIDQQSLKQNKQSQNIIIITLIIGQYIFFFIKLTNKVEKESNEIIQTNELVQNNNQIEQEASNQNKLQEIEKNNNFQINSQDQSQLKESVIQDQVSVKEDNKLNVNQLNESFFSIEAELSNIQAQSQQCQSDHPESWVSDQRNIEVDYEENSNLLDQQNYDESSSELAKKAAYKQSHTARYQKQNLSNSSWSDQDGKKQNITHMSLEEINQQIFDLELSRQQQNKEICQQLAKCNQQIIKYDQQISQMFQQHIQSIHLDSLAKQQYKSAAENQYQSYGQVDDSNQNNQTKILNDQVQSSQTSESSQFQNSSKYQQNDQQSSKQVDDSNQKNKYAKIPNDQVQSSQTSKSPEFPNPQTNQQNNQLLLIEQNGTYTKKEEKQFSKKDEQSLQISRFQKFHNSSPNRKQSLSLSKSNNEFPYYNQYQDQLLTQKIIEKYEYIQQFLIEMKQGKITIQNLAQIIQIYYQQLLQLTIIDHQILPHDYLNRIVFDNLIESTFNLSSELKFGKITIQNLQQSFIAFCQYILNAQQHHQIFFQQLLASNFSSLIPHLFEQTSNFFFQLKFGKIVIQNLLHIIEEFYKKLQLMKNLNLQSVEYRQIQDFQRSIQNQLQQKKIFYCYELKQAKIILQNLFQIIDKNHNFFLNLLILDEFFCIRLNLINQTYYIIFTLGIIGESQFNKEQYRNSREPQVSRSSQELIGHGGTRQNSKILNQNDQTVVKQVQRKSKKKQKVEKMKQKSANKEEITKEPPNELPAPHAQYSSNSDTINQNDNVLQKTTSLEVEEEQFQQFIRLIIRLDFDYDKILEYIYGGQNLDAQSNSFGYVNSENNQRSENLQEQNDENENINKSYILDKQ